MDKEVITQQEYKNDGSYVHLYYDPRFNVWSAYGVSGAGHHSRQVRSLPVCHPIEENRHDQRRRLVVRQLTAAQAVHKELQLLPGQFLVLRLLLNDVVDPHAASF